MFKKGLITIAMTAILSGCGGGGGDESTNPAPVISADLVPEATPAPEITPDPAPEVIPDPAPEVTPDPAPEVPTDPVSEISPEPESLPDLTTSVRFLLRGAVSVVTTDNTAIKTVSGANLPATAKAGHSKLNSFTFINADNAEDFKKQKRAALAPMARSSSVTSREGEEESSASNLFVIDENGEMSFAAESQYDFKVSYSVVKSLKNAEGEDEQFVYFTIADHQSGIDNDFWISKEFIKAADNCAIFKVATADGSWDCVAPNLLPIAMNDQYRQTMSDDKRKPLQVDDQGNVFVLARDLIVSNEQDSDGDGVNDFYTLDPDWSVEPTIRKVSLTGEVKKITRDDIYVQSYIKIDDDSLVYSYSGENTGLKMIVGLSGDNQSTVELGRQGYWNDFFYAIDDHNTIIFSQNGGESNKGISFGQKSETFIGGAETFKLNTKDFSSNSWDSTPRRVILADDGSIYGLFEDYTWNNETQTSESWANLKRILPYSKATFARFNVGSNWWGYFDNGQRNIQLSKGYAFYLEDQEHGAYGKRTNIKAVRMVDGELTTMLDGDWAAERYEISTWKLSGDTIYFSGFDTANSQMIAGEVDTLKMKQGLAVDEYLTIGASASIVGANNVIDDYEVLRASAPDNFTGGNPRIVQTYSDPENVFSASIEFNKYMNTDSVNALTSVTYTNESDELIDVTSMKVWLGRRLHLIFDANYDPANEVDTDPLPYGTELSIAVDGNALDLEGLQLLMSETPLTASFSTRPETGFYTSSAEVIDGVSDGIVLRYSAAEDRNGKQAVANLATDIKTINHRVEFSTPAKIEGRFELRLKDPYQANWANLDSEIMDSVTGIVWQSFDSFEVNATKTVYRHNWGVNSDIDPKWERVLEKMELTPTVTVNDEVFLDSDNTKTYQQIPHHLVDMDGVMFSDDYDSLRQTGVRKNLDTGVKYYFVDSYLKDTETEVEYRWSFSAWRDSEGNELPEGANTIHINAQWLSDNNEVLVDSFEWVNQSWVNVDDETDVINKPETTWVYNYYGADINGDGKFDLSGLAAFGGRAEADEATVDWQDNWSWQTIFEAENFEVSSDDYRSYSDVALFGSCCSSSQFEHVSLDSDYSDYFNKDYDSILYEELITNSTWLKHTFEYVTDTENATIVNFSYVVTDNEGSEVYSTTKKLFIDVYEASWKYFTTDDPQGGFGLELSIQNNGSVSIDNLKVTDLSDLDNAETGGVILSSDFTNGNEGVFVEVQQ